MFEFNRSTKVAPISGKSSSEIRGSVSPERIGMIPAERFAAKAIPTKISKSVSQSGTLVVVAWMLCVMHGKCQTMDTNVNANQVAPNTIPNTVQLAPPQAPPPPTIIDMQHLYDAQISETSVGEVSPVARTSGVSAPSGRTAPVFEERGYIASIVTPNPFLPPDLITSSEPVALEPLRLNQPWNLSAEANESVNYDSNIERAPDHDHLGDGYLHNSGGLDFRLGTKADSFALDLAYDYTADLFSTQHEFDTYTHNFAFSSRIGRSSFVLIPFVVGRFSSVESQAGTDSGRESYDFLQAGAHGENSYYSDLVHTYDFSHTTVYYPAKVGANFGIWDLSQQLNFNLPIPPGRHLLQNLQFFSWLDVKRTIPDGVNPVDEVSGGFGGTATLFQNLTVKAKVGWGSVSSNDQSVNYDSYSGFRYDTGFFYQPWSFMVVSTDFQRVLSFTPQIRSHEVDVIDSSLAFPLVFNPHFTVTPAIGCYHAISDDYLDPSDSSIYIRPSLSIVYKFNEHFAAFGKFQYSSEISNEFRSTETDYTNDTQGSVGMTLLF